MARQSFVQLVLLSILCLGCATALGAPDSLTTYRSPGATRKVFIPAGPAATAPGVGGRLVADYGSFAVMEVPDASASILTAAGLATTHDEQNLVMLNKGPFDTRTATARTLMSRAVVANEPAVHLVQFAGPVKGEWLATLEKTGVRVVQPIPFNAYAVFGTPDQIGRVRALAVSEPFVQWDGNYLPDHKVQPGAMDPGREMPDAFVVQVVDDGSGNRITRALIDASKTADIQPGAAVLQFFNLYVRMDPGLVGDIAERPDVFAVLPYHPRKLHDEIQALLMANQTDGLTTGPEYLDFLAARGFPQNPANYPVVCVVDDGIDVGGTDTVDPVFHEGGVTTSPSRMVFNARCTVDATANSIWGHGHLNAGIVGGYDMRTGDPYQDSLLFRRGMGISPFGRVAGLKIFSNSGQYDVSWCGGSDAGVVSRVYELGANITNNSWGAYAGGAYDDSSQVYDLLTRDASSVVAGNQQMLHVCSAGNSGSGANTIGSPGSAKNILCVGATENVRDNGVTDGCGFYAADNVNDMASFSSRGPCDDGRIKPDIVAPGTHIQGTASPDPAYDGTGVCSQYYPAGQTVYAMSSGTSHACPAVAGAASLAWNWLARNGFPNPSPALAKAFLMGTARYLTGAWAGDTLPSNNQGFGLSDTGRAFDDAKRVFLDQAHIFHDSGENYTTYVVTADPARETRITLAWTDAPGPLTGSAYVNNLDLQVIAGGGAYLGNHFTGAYSTAGGTADLRNNVESVFLPAGLTGAILVRVVATGISGDAIPGNGDTTDQDFALSIYNAESTSPFPIARGAGTTLTMEMCSPPDNAVGPNETVTMDFGIGNAGSAPFSNLVATLETTGGVTAPSAPQVYGAIPPGGSVVVRSYTFTADAPCDGVIRAFLRLADGGVDVGRIGFDIPVTPRAHALLRRDFTSTEAISIPVRGNATPYPSSIPVSGISGTVDKVVVSISGFTHTYPGDVKILLASPSGRAVLLLSSRGGGTDITDVNLTFDDEAAGLVPSPIVSGTFRPSVSSMPGSFPAPAPPVPYSTVLSAFRGEDPNGSWDLFVIDSSSGDSGQIAGGWSLSIRHSVGICCGAEYPPIIQAAGYQLVGEEIFDGKIDPGEGVTLALSNANVGTVDATDIFGTLVPSAQFAPSVPMLHYGAMPGFGAVTTRNLPLNATASCGTTMTILMDLVDNGTTDCGQSRYDVPMCVNLRPAPMVRTTGTTLTAEGCLPANGVIDPGEVVTVDFGLRNLGNLGTNDLWATLQATGGVTPVTPSRQYGALAAGGGAVVQPFHFQASGDCGSSITATLVLTDGTENLGSLTTVFPLGFKHTDLMTTFALAESNTTTITIPASGKATPYPSAITVATTSTRIRKATVTLDGLNHTFLSDVAILLAGPQGQNVLLVDGAGNKQVVTTAVLTFDDAATQSLPQSSAIVSGTYKPTSYRGYATAITTPAPQPPYGQNLAVFNDTDPQGEWQLYVFDRFAGDTGSIAGGWSLALELSPVYQYCCGDGQNNPPVLTVPGPQSVVEDTETTITGISVTDIDVGSNTMITTVSALHATLAMGGLVGPEVTFQGTLAETNAALATLVFRNDPGFFLGDVIRIVTSDNGFTGTGGPRFDSKSVPVSIIHVNLPPVLTVPGSQVVAEDGSISLPCGVSDPDAVTSPIQVTLAALNGYLTLGSTGGLAWVGGANGTSRLVFSASQSDATAALATLGYRPQKDFNGSDTVTVVADDLGHSGLGGSRSTTETVGVSVTPVGDPPVATLARTALHFDGTEHVQIPDTDNQLDAPAGTSITLEAWVRLDVLTPPSTFQILACKGMSDGDWNANYSLLTYDGTLVYFYNNSEGLGAQWNSNPILTAGPWYHVAVCDDFSLARTPVLFVNGVAVPGAWYAAPTLRTPKVSDDPAMIGAALPDALVGPDYRLFGDIDEVRLWDCTFDTTGIQRMMRTRVVGNEPHLKALWRLDEARGTTVTESAGHADGFVVGSPEWIVSGAGIDHIKTVQHTDVVVVADGVDFDFNTTLTAFITGLPAAGTLYQYDAGHRGPPITVPGTTVSDPLARVIFSPGNAAPAIPFAQFKYGVADDASLSEWVTVTVDVYPLYETPPIPAITLSDADPTGNWAPDSVTKHTSVTVTLENPPPAGTAQWLELSDETEFTTPTVFPYAAQATVPFAVPSGDGPKAVYARLRSTAFGPGLATTGTILLDQTPPAVTISPVIPDPRSGPVPSLDFTFAEKVHGVIPASLALTRNAGTNLLPGGTSLTTTDSVHFILQGLAGLTAAPGVYEFVIAPVGITDEAGNAMVASASRTWMVVPPDLVLTKDDTPDPARAANPLTYTLGVHNAGTAAATGVTLVDTLSTAVKYVSASATQGTVGCADGVVTASLGTLAADGRATVTVEVLPRTIGSAVVPPSWQVTNAAQVFATEEDLNPADNIAIANTTVQPMAGFSADFLTTSTGWQQYLQDPPVGDVSYGNLTGLDFDGANTALRARISADPGTATTAGVAGLFRASGWRTTDANALATLPYSSVGTANVVRSKWFVYATGSVPATTNMIPATRVQLYNRTVVGTTLEIFTHKNDGTAGISGDELGAEVRPAADPANPSVYRCDYDPVDVPFLLANAATESIGRGFIAQSEQTQDNGFIGVAEVITAVYPRTLTSGTLIQTLVPTASDAGGLRTTGVTTPDGTGGPSRLRFIYPFIGAGRIGIADFSGGPTISEGSTGVTMDSTAFDNQPSGGLPTRAAISLLGFYPGDDYAARPRVSSGKQYRVRFHVYGTRASNLQAGLRLQAATGNFTYAQKFEISGSTAGGAQAQTILAQTQPGPGTQNPDKRSPLQVDGYYNLLMYTPLAPEVRPENPALTLAERFPNWFTFAGQGVNDLGTFYGGATPAGLNRRDIRLFAALLDTLTFSANAVNESGNYTIDEIRVYEADAVDDGNP